SRWRGDPPHAREEGTRGEHKNPEPPPAARIGPGSERADRSIAEHDHPRPCRRGRPRPESFPSCLRHRLRDRAAPGEPAIEALEQDGGLVVPERPEGPP